MGRKLRLSMLLVISLWHCAALLCATLLSERCTATEGSPNERCAAGKNLPLQRHAIKQQHCRSSSSDFQGTCSLHQIGANDLHAAAAIGGELHRLRLQRCRQR
jgi:hypothetical protein